MSTKSFYSWDKIEGAVTGAETRYDFPYDAVDAALGWKEPGEPKERDSDSGSEAVSEEALKALSSTLWLLADQVIPDNRGPIELSVVGARLVSLLYLARPHAFSQSGSIKQLAERCGCTRQSLTTHINKFSEAYGFRLANAIPEARRERYREAQIAQWKRRKEKIESAVEKEMAKPAAKEG